MSVLYVGSGPYCYANSLAMMFGDEAPDPGVIEVVTGSPFGMQLHEGTTPFFDPAGWTPCIGIDAAVGVLGWACDRTGGGTAEEAVERLRRAAPVMVGPVEMGLLRHQPGSGEPIGADHYVVVLGVEDGVVLMHDPQGYPFATLPVEDFVAAWRAESVGYAAEPFTMWANFRRVRDIDPVDAVRDFLPAARRWIGDSGAAAERLAELVEAGLQRWQAEHLMHFAIRVGARRWADASRWLALAGRDEAAEVADFQARLLGALQHPVVVDDRATAVRLLRELARSYEALEKSL